MRREELIINAPDRARIIPDDGQLPPFPLSTGRLLSPPSKQQSPTGSRSGRCRPSRGPWHLAIGETVILLHPPLPLVGVSIATMRECQQNDRTLADGYWAPHSRITSRVSSSAAKPEQHSRTTNTPAPRSALSFDCRDLHTHRDARRLLCTCSIRPRSQCVGGMLLVQWCHKHVLNCHTHRDLTHRGCARGCEGGGELCLCWLTDRSNRWWCASRSGRRQ